MEEMRSGEIWNRSLFPETVIGAVETQGYGQGSVGYYFWWGGRRDLCCSYANGKRKVEDPGEENI